MSSHKTVLATLFICTFPTSFAGILETQAQTISQPGYSRSTKCFRDEYREKYVPGTKDSPGYVRNWTEKVEISCAAKTAEMYRPTPQALDIDGNDCSQGSLIGGMLGAGLGAALSRREGRWIGVPVGVAAGAMVGCQIDGG